MRKNRLRKNKQQAMTKRLNAGKRPMSDERKAEIKKIKQAQRDGAKKRLAKAVKK